ncbi:sensor histidine kinase [Hydrogenophaga sp.]|uniref:sensor histidine kinase n=1 Tax=Hydrogenophaga sp. TaxID=1904254 RepID=UPI00272F886C|nr:sensor histidine kinase [Hydrogenophaga sp.]MDP2018727.1 sensor histidine kinase [Hydrogenophaga sp.]MDP3167635.1 sensor histidine kinase [Hydrogenophaga sp.]
MQARFKLTRHFTITSLVAFGCIAAAWFYFQTRESTLVESVQLQETQTIREMQALLVSRAEDDARRDLLATHESNQAQLARLLSNALWEDTLAPFLAAAQGIDFTRCLDLSKHQGTAPAPGPSAHTQGCLRQQGARVRALPQFAALDTRLLRVMRGSSISTIRLHDLHGTTLYSTNHAQVGEGQSDHVAWQGVVANRDFIASHVPVIDPRTNKTIAVFEVHTDVTTHLHRIQQTSADFRQTAANNQTRLERQALDNHGRLQRLEQMQLMMLAGLLVLLYAAHHSIARRAQAVIEKQAQESNANKQRLAQSEKMSSLGEMVASVAHQLNTPLAFSKSNVFMAIQALDDMAPGIRGAARVLDRVTTNAGDTAVSQPHELDTDSVRSQLSQFPDELRMTQDMLSDVLMGLDQMNEMVDNLRSFTLLDRARAVEVDLNTTLASVIYIAKAVISNRIRVVQKFSKLPKLDCDASQLNQVFLNLIMNAAQAIDGAGVVTVSTALDGQRIRITIEDTGNGIPDDVLPRIFDPYFTTKPMGKGTGLGLAIAKDIVTEHGGTLTVKTQVGVGTTFQIELPIPAGQPA